ncbi:shikimate kinase [Tuberibacillus sp. Marseille-P3662]|uniref:shikimate kinase n=1 Tax=Tuberibacillus sp. Marseille-P3662 TaxID=1965358 RepID=UPI000A1CBE00|nr:shikimate kinase [Tuberibacillus sp. Marseille-P3662]
MNTIYLTGFMGAGKTTVGRELGHRMSMPVWDTDDMIEQVSRKEVQEIFQEEGEARFREYERDIIRNTSFNNAIITTGGGAVVNENNRRFMLQNGIVIFLYCDPKAIVKRLANDTTRPLLDKDKEERINQLFIERFDDYIEADYTVNTTMKSSQNVVSEIMGFLDRHEQIWA